MIRVILPYHLRTLARTEGEVVLMLPGPMTIAGVLDELEARFPMLHGTIRDLATRERRPFLRFYACGQDLSLEPADSPLPEAVIQGKDPLRIVGAMAGG